MLQTFLSGLRSTRRRSESQSREQPISPPDFDGPQRYRVHLSNLPEGMDDSALLKKFRRFGEVLNAYICPTAGTIENGLCGELNFIYLGHNGLNAESTPILFIQALSFLGMHKALLWL